MAAAGIVDETHWVELKEAVPPTSRPANLELAKDLASLAVDGGLLFVGCGTTARRWRPGDVLEEVLARFLAVSGYALLTDAKDEPDELFAGPNGLQVRGRHHQVDGPGELAWVPAFSLPVRLFLETK